MSAHWGGNLRGKGYKPPKPTSTYKTTGQFNITNYNSLYTWNISGGTLTHPGTPYPYVTVPSGEGSATITASLGLVSDVTTVTRTQYTYSPGSGYSYDCSYTTSGWGSCGCECGGGGCGCYGYSSGSWGQCGCPGPMCWYNWTTTYVPQTCYGTNPPTLNTPANGPWTNSGTEWYKIT